MVCESLSISWKKVPKIRRHGIWVEHETFKTFTKQVHRELSSGRSCSEYFGKCESCKKLHKDAVIEITDSRIPLEASDADQIRLQFVGCGSFWKLGETFWKMQHMSGTALRSKHCKDRTFKRTGSRALLSCFTLKSSCFWIFCAWDCSVGKCEKGWKYFAASQRLLWEALLVSPEITIRRTEVRFKLTSTPCIRDLHPELRSGGRSTLQPRDTIQEAPNFN
jgi:hypothetical protein